MEFTDVTRARDMMGIVDLGVLFIHGLSASPASLKDWMEAINGNLNVSVRAPLLPGHGKTWEALSKVRWQDWEQEVLAAYDTLAREHPKVAVCGMSMGGTLACLVAARRKPVAMVLMNHLMWLDQPLFLAPLLRRLTTSLAPIAGDIKKPGVVEPAYDRLPTASIDEMRKLMKVVQPLLPGITIPTLIFKSREDHVIPAISATRTMDQLGSTQKELVWLDNSYHVATLDYDGPLIIERSAQFLWNFRRKPPQG